MVEAAGADDRAWGKLVMQPYFRPSADPGRPPVRSAAGAGARTGDLMSCMLPPGKG